MDREIAFRQMRETLIMLLTMSIKSKCIEDEEERTQERLRIIKNVCGELMGLWGIGYRVLEEGQEELLCQICGFIDTLSEN